MTVVVTGTLGYDYIMDFPGKFVDRIMPDKLHQISLSFLVNKMTKQMGGTAGNIAYTLKLLGIDPTLISAAGNDFGPYADFLTSHAIDISHIKTASDLATGSYFVVTDQNDNQIGSFYSGATQYAQDLSVNLDPKPDLVVISPTDPVAMKKYADECIANSLPYLFDPAFQIDAFTAEELTNYISHAQIFIGNDYEVALVEKKIGQITCPMIITTLGEKGSTIKTADRLLTIPIATPTQLVDPTGAGDSFRGGFLAGYLRKLDLQTCGQIGALAAAYVVENYGTTTHNYFAREFCQRYFDNFHTQLVLDPMTTTK